MSAERSPDRVRVTTRRGARIAAAVALASLLAAGEAAVMKATSFTSALALAPQVAAPGAIGTFHDLRWILVYHDSWSSLAVVLVLGIALRTLVTAASSWAVWPREFDRPAWWSFVTRSVLYVVISVALLLPWTAIAMAASATSLSWFVLGELAPFTVIVVASALGPFRLDWWRSTPSACAMGWTVVLLLWATASGAAVTLTPGWWAVPVSGLLGAGFVALWLPLTRAALSPSRWSRIPASGIVVALVFAVTPTWGLVATYSSDRASSGTLPGGISANGTQFTIIFVDGYDSSYGADGLAPEGVRIFSYAGSDGVQNPLPYSSPYTHQSIDSSARMLADQVSAAARRSGQQVAIVAESEGTVVLRRYLDTLPHPDVGAAVMLDPLVFPGRSYYPPQGATSGWGLAGGWTLRGIVWLVRATGHSRIGADEPFVRSMLDDAPFYRNRMLCPVTGVRLIAFVPTDSAAIVPPNQLANVPVVIVNGIHGSLLGRPNVNEQIKSFLRGESVESVDGTSYGVMQRAAAAWQAPALALSLNPAWAPSPWGDAAFDGPNCGP